MREWGVLAGTGDRLSLTSTGLAIALPTSEDSEKEALQKAFFSAAVFAKTYADVAKDTPLELTALGNNAVHTHGVSITARDDFTRSLVASAIAAGIATAPDSDPHDASARSLMSGRTRSSPAERSLWEPGRLSGVSAPRRPRPCFAQCGPSHLARLSSKSSRRAPSRLSTSRRSARLCRSCRTSRRSWPRTVTVLPVGPGSPMRG